MRALVALLACAYVYSVVLCVWRSSEPPLLCGFTACMDRRPRDGGPDPCRVSPSDHTITVLLDAITEYHALFYYHQWCQFRASVGSFDVHSGRRRCRDLERSALPGAGDARRE